METLIDFGEPKQNGFEYPMPLTEKSKTSVRESPESTAPGGRPARWTPRFRKDKSGHGLR